MSEENTLDVVTAVLSYKRIEDGEWVICGDVGGKQLRMQRPPSGGDLAGLAAEITTDVIAQKSAAHTEARMTARAQQMQEQMQNAAVLGQLGQKGPGGLIVPGR